MRSFVHLSDLHFGRTDKRVTRGLLDELHRLNPDLLVISGDLTQSAARREFSEAVGFLEEAPGIPFVVPGNHDLPGWNVLARFLRRFARYRRYIGLDMNPVYQDRQLVLVGLNTARTVVYHWNWSHGRLSRRQLAAVDQSFNHAPQTALRAVVMHHPIVPPSYRPDQKLVGGARRAARRFSEAHTDIVLTGHLHRPTDADLQVRFPEIRRSVRAFQAGTTLSDRLRGDPNCFRFFQWTAPDLHSDLFEWNGRRFEGTVSQKYIRTPTGLDLRQIGKRSSS